DRRPRPGHPGPDHPPLPDAGRGDQEGGRRVQPDAADTLREVAVRQVAGLDAVSRADGGTKRHEPAAQARGGTPPLLARRARTARQSPADSPRMRRYSRTAWSYAARASARSPARMFGCFCFQHCSTASRHHCADFLLARIGLPSTSTNTGLVWLDGRIRSATQLDRSTGTSKLTSRSLPSASTSLRATGLPFTTTSTG